MDIKNYNKFLIELDKKQTTQTTQPFQKMQKVNKIEDINLQKQQDKIKKSQTTNNDLINFTKLLETDIDAILHKYKLQTASKQVSIHVDTCENVCMYNHKSKDDFDVSLNTKPGLTTEDTTIPLTEKVKTKVNIVAEINNINDLLTLIETYPEDDTIEYNINMTSLHKIKAPLMELNSMIGMNDLKINIVDQIIFYIQNFHVLTNNKKQNDFMHTVIYGSPGTGKTEIAKIIGSIFSNMGILSKGTFKKVVRSDLIAGYLGQTALKTRDVINESLGGVLFIDEAYALGNEEKKDNFSKECIDTLCEALSDHKDNLMVIIAGYETELNNCFFIYNRGLQSRFTWRFKTDEYNAEELYKIFLKKVDDYGWFIDVNSGIDCKWFDKNKAHFKSYGRDIETLFAKTKISHSKRVFCLDASVKKYITIQDLNNGLELYLKNENSQEREKEKMNKLVSSMYI